jgi:hypothetical protein
MVDSDSGASSRRHEGGGNVESPGEPVDAGECAILGIIGNFGTTPRTVFRGSTARIDISATT